MSTFPFRHEYLVVNVPPASHGPWDVALLVLATIAAVGAAVGVWAWVVQLRKTPEVRFQWYRPDGTEWEPDDDPLPLIANQTFRLNFAITNVGTGAADGAIVNVLGPHFVNLHATDKRDDHVLPNYDSGDPVISDPPDNRIRWMAMRVYEFYPTLPVMVEVGVTFDHGQPLLGHPYFFAVSFEAVGLSASGNRLWPSWAHRVQGEGLQSLQHLTSKPWWPNRLHWGVEDFWGQSEFPGRRYRRSLRRIRALPHGHVRSGPGKRQDRRSFILRAPAPSPYPLGESLEPGVIEARAKTATVPPPKDT